MKEEEKRGNLRVRRLGVGGKKNGGGSIFKRTLFAIIEGERENSFSRIEGEQGGRTVGTTESGKERF